MAPNLPRVLIVDDHSVVRMGLRAMIEQSGRYAAREQPEVVILDLMLGG
jgi:DNA-binding NarL/FixJ family response regulator